MLIGSKKAVSKLLMFEAIPSDMQSRALRRKAGTRQARMRMGPTVIATAMEMIFLLKGTVRPSVLTSVAAVKEPCRTL